MTAATVVDVPSKEPPTEPLPDDSDSGVTDEAFATSPEKALLLAEIERTRTFCLFILPLVVAAGPISFLIGGDEIARWLFCAGLAVVALAAAWVLWVIRDPDRYHVKHNVIFGMACVVGVTGAFYYWGPYSAVLLLVPFGAHIFSMVESVHVALTITILVMASHLSMSGLILGDVIADRGVIRMPSIGLTGQLIILGLIHAIFLATFAVARELRRSAQRSMEQLDQVSRAVARRDALLAEARQDLNRALQIGGPGPYTGQTIGSFELGPILGRGAMGEVYEAVHTTDQQPCAVKLLNPRVMADSSHYQRFLREAEIAASLDVPNVVRVIEIATGEDSLPFLAMEKLDGEDLSSYLKKHPRMPIPEVIELIEQIGAGLAAAHELGVIHRDLKPHNLFRAVDPAGVVTWKVLDFGVSKLIDGEGTLTQGRVVGTPGYMAPEQARGDEVDGRADLYSLGVIAYRTITGIPAFAGAGDVPKLLYQVVYTMPQRPSSVANVTPEMDAVLAVAMAKSPADRFPTASELAAAIKAADAGSITGELRHRASRLLRAMPWKTTPRPLAR